MAERLSRLSKLWLFILSFSCVIFLSNVIIHEKLLQQAGLLSVLSTPPADLFNSENNNDKNDGRDTSKQNVEYLGSLNDHHQHNNHTIAGLSCGRYGGPSHDDTEEMVYWEDIPRDSSYVSPFYNGTTNTKYLTFEPDGGGWNNIRMAMETVIVMAHAMGRTLVLPPEKRMYLIGRGDKNQKFKFTFNDFFHLDSIRLEHAGFNMITMEEFLVSVGMEGKLVDLETGLVQLPPENRTKWDGEDLAPLWKYLRETTFVRNWRPMKCIAAFPSNPNSTTRLEESLALALEQASNMTEEGALIPVDVDGNIEDRMRESLGGREELCLYDDVIQNAHVVHFMCSHKDRSRLLAHFYTFLFFENWEQDLFIKRFVRDHLRYSDEIMCAAARVVQAIRIRARKRNPDLNPSGTYDSFHIRRGDFQYKSTQISSDEIIRNSQDMIQPGSTIFIATDERNKTFFAPMMKMYDVCFLDDFKDLLKEVNTNYYGMLDQIIASKGRTFFGTFFSTLSGYIVRMRGYAAAKNMLRENWNGGLNNTFYFVPVARKMEMSRFTAIRKLYFSREFPVSWRDIDKSVMSMEVELL